MFVRLLLGAMLATALASAQGMGGGGGGKGGKGGGMNSMGGGMPSQRPTKLQEFADKLKLTKEQRDDLLGMVRAAVEQSAPLRDQLNQGRVAIAGAMIEGKSADDLKKLTDDYTSLAAQMTTIEAATFGKIYGTLKPNQQAKAGQAFELLVAVLDRPGGGSTGGRGRGR
jgi:Spy/CpxP family protein refolding chaperone